MKSSRNLFVECICFERLAKRPQNKPNYWGVCSISSVGSSWKSNQQSVVLGSAHLSQSQCSNIQMNSNPLTKLERMSKLPPPLAHTWDASTRPFRPSHIPDQYRHQKRDDICKWLIFYWAISRVRHVNSTQNGNKQTEKAQTQFTNKWWKKWKAKNQCLSRCATCLCIWRNKKKWNLLCELGIWVWCRFLCCTNECEGAESMRRRW